MNQCYTYNDYDDSNLQRILGCHRDGCYQDEDEDPGDNLRRGWQHVHGPCQRMRREARTRHPQDCNLHHRVYGRRQFTPHEVDRIHWQLVRWSATWTRRDAKDVRQWSHGSRA